MIPLLIAAGFSLNIHQTDPTNSVRIGIFETFLILYTAAYSPGAGVSTLRNAALPLSRNSVLLIFSFCFEFQFELGRSLPLL